VSRRFIVVLAALLFLGTALNPGDVRASGPLADGSVVTQAGRVLPPMPAELLQPSIEAQMLAQADAQQFTFAPGGSPTIVLDGNGRPRKVTESASGSAGAPDGSAGTLLQPLASSGLPNGLRKEVLGFLPYWMLDSSTLGSMNYQLVSTIAYFSVGLQQDGSLTKGTSSGWSGWSSAAMTQVLDRAHENGVRVVMTVTMMSWGSTSNMSTFLNSATNRRRAVDQIVAAVGARSADGVNLDFEPVPASLRDQYTAFVAQLKAGLSAAGVGDYLTVCVTAGAATWATGYDIAGLTASGAADHLFVMGYDYNWSGSARAGGVAPIRSPYTVDVDGTMRDFLAETSGSKVIWGVPYYGRTWPTTSGQLNSTTRSGTSSAYYYTGSLSLANKHGRLWDDVGAVPWFRFKDGSGQWVQGYYDDAESLGVKYDLVNARGFAGTGMWTLLMDAGSDDLWKLLADKFVTDVNPPVGGITLLPESEDSQSVMVSWRVVDYVSGVQSYTVQVRKDGGAWQTWLSGTHATAEWYTGTAGSTYEFRVQAVDWKGNAQPWVGVPAEPASVQPEAFAQVVTGTLNVRSGPSTAYASIDKLAAGDRVYVIDGPVTAAGYDWYRIQYGFGEWPSADYPEIGWSAVGDGVETYLAPAAPPTATTLDPFVVNVTATPAFSPNGDGRRDQAAVDYRLQGPADDVQLQVVNAAGDVVRTVDLGAQPGGDGSTGWDGSVDSGGVAPEGRYLVRIVATDAEGTHVGPAPAVDDALLAALGTSLDLTAPQVAGSDPAAAAQMVPASSRVVIDFSEPMWGIGARSVQLRRADGSVIPAHNRVVNGRTRLIIVPDEPLPTGTRVQVRISPRARDAAGNQLGLTKWDFRTAPGEAFSPAAHLTVERGTHTAYVIGTGGALSSPRQRWFGSTSGADASQRAKMPNLPGRWLFVDNGVFAGRWLRESALDHLSGTTERHDYASSTRIAFAAGTHTGYRFDSSGAITASRSYTLGSVSGANINARAVINGRLYLAVVNGIWAGYWLPESAAVHMAGTAERIDFSPSPRLVFAAGTYTGYRFSSGGAALSRVTATLWRTSGANASAWAVINGVPYYQIANGIWSGTWVPEQPGLELDAS
jgi:spore germination protein YaaH